MTPHAPRRRAIGSLEDLGAMGSVALAVLLNIALFTMILGIGLPTRRGPEADAAALLPPIEVEPLDPSCDGDALLRAAAQAAMCLTPLADDPDACVDQVGTRLESELLLCHVDQMEALPEIAMVDVPDEVIEQMESIDAEPLLEPLTPEEMKKFAEKLQELLPPPTPTPPQPPPPPAMQKQAQVIETPKPANEEAPDDTAYLSEYDSKVDKQSVKHVNKYEEMVSRPEPEELATKANPKEATRPDPVEDAEPGKEEDAPPTKGALSMRSPGTPERAEVSQDKQTAGASDGSTDPAGGTKPAKGDGAVSQDEKHRTEIAEGQGGAGGGKPRAPNLRPDDETLERLVGGGSVDHTEDVEEGEENAFNTKRWVYASFFNRMKRIVAQNWDPVSVWRSEDPEGSHYGFKTRVTILRVSLDAKGNVEEIIVLQPCGIDSLDDEAIRAFKASDPFPNPPQALIDKDGLIVFEFGFSFEINKQSTSWKLSRSI